MTNRLIHLQHVALAEFARHTKATAEAIDAYLACGEALAEAKATVAHGEWLPWLAAAGIPPRTAQRMLLLHGEGFKSDTVTYLGGIRATLDALPALHALQRASDLWERGKDLEGVAFKKLLADIWKTERDARDFAWFLMWKLGETPDGPIPKPHDDALFNWVAFYKTPRRM